LLVLLPAAVYASAQDHLTFRQNGTLPPASAGLTLAHFAPFADTAAETAVTVQVNGEDEWTDLRYGDIISDVVLAAGTYSITVRPADAPTGTSVISDTVTLSTGVRYTLAAIGDGANQPLELFTLVNDGITPTTGANVRIAHLAPFAAGDAETAVDLCTEDDTVVVSDLRYREVTQPALNLAAGDYDLKVALAGTNCQEVALDLPSIRLSDGETIDLFVIGDITNQPLELVSTTGFTQTPDGEGKTRIVILVDATPERMRNFRFGGDLGIFKLDDDGLPGNNSGNGNDDDDQDGDDQDGDGSDQDEIRRRRAFRVDPGTYVVGEVVPYRWHLVDIVCQGGNSTVNLLGDLVTINAGAGETITCTFVNERDTTLRVRKYLDENDNSQWDRTEQALGGWTITLFDDQGAEVATSATNVFGKANFRFLRAGEYTVCETQQNGWTNTQPGRLNPDFGNQPCYTFTADPAEITYLRFGNLNDVSTASAATRPHAYINGISQMADPYEDADDAGYEAPAEDVDADLLQPDDPSQHQPTVQDQIFLPLIAR
jgi:hypothetical protein